LTPPDPETAPRALRLRSLVLQALVVGALLALIVITVAGLVPGSGKRLQDASLGWMAVGVLLELMAIAAYAVLFHGVFSYGAYRVKPVRSAEIATGELAGYAASPTGAAGPAIRFWALLRGGMPFREVTKRSVEHGAILQIPYIIAAGLLGVGVVLGVGTGHARTAVALAPVGLVVVTIAAVFVATRLAQRPARSSAGWRTLAREALQAVPQGVRALPMRLRNPLLLPSAAAYWAFDCAVLVVAIHAAHGSAQIGVIALAYMLGQLGNALPLPGGIGGVEPLMLGVLTSSGVSLGVGAAAVVLYRLVSLGLQAVLGGIALATLLPSLQRAGGDAGSNAVGAEAVT
jgi:putative heme transporter